MTAAPTGAGTTSDVSPATERGTDSGTGADTGTGTAAGPATTAGAETAPDTGDGTDPDANADPDAVAEPDTAAAGDADQEVAAGHDDGQAEDISPRYVIRTTAGCLLFGAFGHVILWIAYSSGSNASRMGEGLPPIGVWQPAVGVSIVGVALIAFGGFYAAALRARVAITASFLLSFLIVLSYALTIPGFASAMLGDAEALVGDFRAVVITVVGFYFGSEAIVSAVKVYGVAKSNGTAGDIVRADRDLPGDRQGVKGT